MCSDERLDPERSRIPRPTRTEALESYSQNIEERSVAKRVMARSEVSVNLRRGINCACPPPRERDLLT